MLRLLPVCLALAALSAPARAETDELEGLTEREAAAVRRAILGIDPGLLRGDEHAALVRAVRIAAPSLDDEERERIDLHLRRHAPTLRQVHEMIQVRRHWRKRIGERFTWWWNPDRRGPDGLPSRSPTTAEVREMERLAERTSERFGLEPVAWLPYRIDRASAAPRVLPRDDLRWGIWTPRLPDEETIVEALLSEAGRVPGLLRPLALLHGRCADAPPCRAQLLEHAHRVVATVGALDVLEVLQAAAVSGEDDPALATGLLFVDLVEREQGLGVLVDLLRRVSPDHDASELRRVVRDVLGTGSWTWNRRLRREQRRWVEARRLEAAERGAPVAAPSSDADSPEPGRGPAARP